MFRTRSLASSKTHEAQCGFPTSLGDVHIQRRNSFDDQVDLKTVIQKATSSNYEKQHIIKSLSNAQTIIQIKAVHHRAIHLDQSLRQLRQDMNQKTSIVFDDTTLARFVDGILAQIKKIRNNLLFLCREKLVDKQIGLLLSITKQMYPTFDISVQFFGIDWNHLLKVSYHLIQNVDLLSNCLLRQGSTTLNILLPSNILRDLAIIEADVAAHGEALRLGRLQHRKLKTTAGSVASTDCHNSPSKRQKQPDNFLTKYGKLIRAQSTSQIVVDTFRGLRNALRFYSSSTSLHKESHHQLLSQSSKVSRSPRFAFRNSNNKEAVVRQDDLWKAWYNGLQSITMAAKSDDDDDPTDNDDGEDDFLQLLVDHPSEYDARDSLIVSRQRAAHRFSRLRRSNAVEVLDANDDTFNDDPMPKTRHERCTSLWIKAPLQSLEEDHL